MLKINGSVVTTPSKFKVDISDLDGETGRNARGELIRDRVAVKRKLQCEWTSLNMAQISKILQAVKDEFFQVEYPDPMEGKVQTKTFYVGDRTAPLFRVGNNGEHLWEGLSLNFIER